VEMRKYRFSSKAPDPRVLCVSNRDIAPVISRCWRYEFEDLLSAMDAVDVIAPADTGSRRRRHRRAERHPYSWAAGGEDISAAVGEA
jgi:hypothetical protein